MKSVFSYGDYRAYLRDYYQERKRADEKFSFAAFARKAECQSVNYLKLVMEGDRNLTVSNIQAFAKALGLKGIEREYFEALVLMNQAKRADEKKYYAERLKRLRPPKSANLGRRSPTALFSKSYVPAVMVLAAGRNSEEAPQLIARQLNLSLEEVTACLGLLVEQGALEITGGKYELEFASVHESDPRGVNSLQREFLKHQLRESLQSFERHYPRTGKYQSHTFTLPHSSIPDVNARVRAFIESLVIEADDPSTREVVQLNLQCFPIGNG